MAEMMDGEHGGSTAQPQEPQSRLKLHGDEWPARGKGESVDAWLNRVASGFR